jgi:hypothetical protein
VRRYLQDKGYDGIVYSNTGEVAEADALQLRVRRRQNELYQRFPEAMERINSTIQNPPEYKRYGQAKADDNAFRETNGLDSYIVFAPNQIKSVDNNGLFDIDCDDFVDETSRRNPSRATKNRLRG